MITSELTTVDIVIGSLLSICLIGVLWYVVLVYLRRHTHKAEVETDYEKSFESRIPEYASTIVAWLESEHPYFDQSFKLIDVARVVPLNRTYLSRIFNEGIGRSFNDYIRDLRMAEAKRLLVAEPTMTIADIAERCGFAGHSSFLRSFVQFAGMTPREYRQRNVENDDPNRLL